MRVITLVMTGSPVQLLVPSAQNPQGNVAASLMMVQANTANAYMGDNTVSSSNGLTLTSGTVYPFVFSQPRGSLLSQYWFVGTGSDTVTVLYETAQ